MRLYAVADIHGRFDRMVAIKNNLEMYRPDMLIAAGDITQFRTLSCISELGDLSLPVLAIRGNTDLKRVEYQFALKENIFFLDNRDVTLQGIHFAGASGTIPIPFRSRIAFREAFIWKRLMPLMTPRTILVAHPPPRGCRDRVAGKYHAGCKSLERFIRACQPALLICGHIHEDVGMACLGKTLIVNCAMGPSCEGAIIDIQNGRISAEILKSKGQNQNSC
ncbi:MAG: metallophosphoesterase family protein [Deltaproteobacteria bacterium]|nr:metallophosphoesterase family protein [Deltaproteobacteria bacterium]